MHELKAKNKHEEIQQQMFRTCDMKVIWKGANKI